MVDRGQLTDRRHVIMEMSKTLVSMYSTEDELYQESFVCVSIHCDV